VQSEQEAAMRHGPMKWLLLLSICLLAQPAPAQLGSNDGIHNPLQVGRGLICNTEQQVARYVTLFKGDSDRAIEAVNAEAQDDNACAVVRVVFVPAAAGTTVRNGTGTYRVVRIVVFGVVTSAGVLKVRPFVQFAAAPVEEIET
jgi:hypothetical protein